MDHAWLIEFFTGLLLVFVLVNILFLLPIGLLGGEPTIVAFIMKIFCGSCITIMFVIVRGFQLQNEL